MTKPAETQDKYATGSADHLSAETPRYASTDGAADSGAIPADRIVPEPEEVLPGSSDVPAKKVLFIFGGTFSTAQIEHHYYSESLHIPFRDDTVRVFFKGCHDSRVGGRYVGGAISADLDELATNIEACFDSSGVLDIAALKEKFHGDPLFESAVVVEPDDVYEKIQATKVGLVGFSRGAVSTFSVARKLDPLGIDISILAYEPVPGNSRSGATSETSEYKKNCDVHHCHSIKKADIILSTPDKQASHLEDVFGEKFPRSLQNTYFRQMAPVLPEACEGHIYIHPGAYHLEDSSCVENHVIHYFISEGFADESGSPFCKEGQQRLYTIPKVVQQKHHINVDGRIQFLPEYKAALLLKYKWQMGLIDVEDREPIDNTGEQIAESADLDLKRVKEVQAELALIGFKKGLSRYLEAIRTQIHADRSAKGIAIREFLVEFNSIIRYGLEQGSSRTKLRFAISQGARDISKDNIGKHEDLPEEVQKVGQDILKEVYAFQQIEHPSLQDKEQLKQTLLTHASQLKKTLTAKQFEFISQAMEQFMDDNIICYPELSQYIDEQETFETRRVTTFNRAIMEKATNVDELAEQLFHGSSTMKYLTSSQRDSSYATHKAELKEFIKNIDDLVKITRFLPPSKIEDMLKQQDIKEKVSSMLDLIKLMDTCPDYAQRKKIFHAYKEIMTEWSPTLTDVTKLMTYLSIDKCKKICRTLPLDTLPLGSRSQFIDIVNKQLPRSHKMYILSIVGNRWDVKKALTGNQRQATRPATSKKRNALFFGFQSRRTSEDPRSSETSSSTPDPASPKS